MLGLGLCRADGPMEGAKAATLCLTWLGSGSSMVLVGDKF